MVVHYVSQNNITLKCFVNIIVSVTQYTLLTVILFHINTYSLSYQEKSPSLKHSSTFPLKENHLH